MLWGNTLDDMSLPTNIALCLLKRKLQACCIHLDIIEWIVDFLGEQTQRVGVINDKGVCVSSPIPVFSRVLLGTMLGPSLFNIYINDAPEILQNLLTLYADDSKLIGAASFWAEVASIQTNLNKLDDWARQWLLEFNSSKCKFLHFGNKNQKHIYTMQNQITGQREPLVAVTEKRDLGVIVDCQLKFQSHTEKIVASANHALGTIKQAFTTRSPQTITKLY
ncbi:uncharacterized protein LOC136028469 [Artemia franciscana]|uniref:uncharacterized protein LOC136028469 n=1 Tax=Artemia franciscana TaxID=6661 RepID=UPI0032DB0C69